MLLAACGGDTPRAPTPVPQREQPRLVVVGDSLAAGRFADTPDETFPQRLATALHARLELVGVPGFTAAQLGAEAVPGDGRFVVIEAGRGLPPAKISPAAYNAAIRRACASVADITTLFDAEPPTRGPEGRITFLGPADDFHPNSVGHAAIAAAIEERLR